MKNTVNLIKSNLFLCMVICLILGLLFTWMTILFSNNAWLPFLDFISDIFLSLSASFFMLRFVESLLENYLHSDIDKSIKDIGFNLITRKNILKDSNVDIVNTEKLIILMNDGKGFISNNSMELEKRYHNNTETVFIFLDMDNEDNENLLCEQAMKQKGYYKLKSNSVIDDIKRKAEEYKNHKFKIYKYNLLGGFKTNIVLTDKEAIMGVYRNSQGKSDKAPPSFVYKKNGNDESEYIEIQKDIDKILSNKNLCTNII